MRKRKYNFNSQIFNKVDTSEKAYWLGFLLGDGSITKNQSSLRLELSNKDLDHLYKFRDFISSDYPIKETNKDCSLISINSIDFTLSLARFGLVPAKTYKDILTPKLKTNLLVDFYRGIFDSDGWLVEHKRIKSPKSSFEFGFSSYNYNFLLEIKNWINNTLNRDIGYLIERKRNKQRVCQLIFGGNTNFKLLYKLFYQNTTNYLLRKKLLADSYYDIISNYIDYRFKENKFI